MTQVPDLTVVIPAYYEERRLGQTLETLADYLRKDAFASRLRVEVLVVVADSRDKTLDIATAKATSFSNYRVLRPGPRAGKGRNVQYGMLRAAGQLVMFMDADLATPLHHIETFYRMCQAGSDIVVGTRNLRAYRDSKWRGRFALFGNRLYRRLSGSAIEDTQCGFKMFTAQANRTCFERLKLLGWGFDLEILAIASANHLQIDSVRLDDWQNQPFSTYNDKPWRITLRMIKDFSVVSIRRMRGVYKIRAK